MKTQVCALFDFEFCLSLILDSGHDGSSAKLPLNRFLVYFKAYGGLRDINMLRVLYSGISIQVLLPENVFRTFLINLIYFFK